MFSSTAVTLFASAAVVLGHGIVSQVVVDGTSYVGTKNWEAPENQKSPVRGIPADTGFVWFNKVNTMDIACSSAGYKGRPVTAPIKAGGMVDIRWSGDKGPSGDEWPHPEGPAIAYLARCDGPCSSFDASNAKFFKIQEEGLDTTKQPVQAWIDHLPWGQGYWIQNKIMLEGSWAHVRIPNDIADGEYLLRHELISLHGAHSEAEGAQYYPACIQIKVTNGGSSKPEGLPATQLYTRQDGLVDIYTPFEGHGIKSYKIPGPPLYNAGQAADPAPTSTTPTTIKAAAASPTTTKAGTIALVASTSLAVTYDAPSATKPASSALAPTTSAKSCKAKRSTRSRSLQDETRAVYDRALARAQARHAHAHKRSADSF